MVFHAERSEASARSVAKHLGAQQSVMMRGYLEAVENPGGSASACNSCGLLADCRVRIWRLAEKTRRVSFGGQR
jgi:hypothetical protein